MVRFHDGLTSPHRVEINLLNSVYLDSAPLDRELPDPIVDYLHLLFFSVRDTGYAGEFLNLVRD